MDNSLQLTKDPKDLFLREYGVLCCPVISTLCSFFCGYDVSRLRVREHTKSLFWASSFVLLVCVTMESSCVIFQHLNGEIFPSGAYKGPTHTKQRHQRHSSGGNGLLMTGVLGANLTSHFFHRVLATLSNGPCHCTA